METVKNDNENQQATSLSNVGWMGKIEEQYRRAKENAEAYPYVWASYVIVYGGFGLWTAYRYRKLRKTEDRVRVLQERLRKLRQENGSATSASKTDSLPSSTEKPTQ